MLRECKKKNMNLGEIGGGGGIVEILKIILMCTRKVRTII